MLSACLPATSVAPGETRGKALQQRFDAEAGQAAYRISGDYLYQVVAELSDDTYGGRGPGTAGDRMTQHYLIQQLQQIRFKPGAQDGWRQVFSLVSIDSKQPDRWTFTGLHHVTLDQHEEFIIGAGKQQPRSSVTDAELVFVGYGIEAPEYDWNDFKGTDLRGKMLVVLNNDPDWDENLFAGNRRLYYGRWRYKYESAARQGAVGAIIIHTTPSAGYGWGVIQSSWTGPQFELPAGDEPRIDVAAWVTEDAARELFDAAGFDLDQLTGQARSRDFRPVPLGLTTSISFDNALAKTESANVLGVLEGADPQLKSEYVIYTAHHDHLGTDPSLEDPIYNGARDNATGVAMLLAIGKAFTALPQKSKRSIMLAFVGAEEQGLLGSQHFARNPPAPAGRFAANVNLDSANIWGPTSDITFIGKGKSSLDEVADSVADFFGRVVKPDQFPDRGSFYRSDQFNMARIGIPALYLKGGTEFIGRPDGWGVEKINEYTAEHYHRPSDELTDDWNFDGMVNDARFAFWAGYLVANDPDLPYWYPGDEFEAARKAALAELE